MYEYNMAVARRVMPALYHTPPSLRPFVSSLPFFLYIFALVLRLSNLLFPSPFLSSYHFPLTLPPFPSVFLSPL